MKPGDRDLGMDRPISRRDFLHGAAGTALASAALAAGCSEAAPPGAVREVGGAPEAHADPRVHPPARGGLRGSHDGSFEVAHRLAWSGQRDWGPVGEPDAEVYDLVVVGAGVSGLAAAFFHREQNPDARILLLENHDDFGGHAKRNEFSLAGRTILGYGGSQTLEAPSQYSDVSRRLLRELAVDVERFETAYDQTFYARHGLAPALFFDRASYGADRLVKTDLIDPSLFLPMASSGVAFEDAVASMPISETARREFLALVDLDEDRLPDVSLLREPGFLQSISYRDLLTQHLGIREPELIGILQDTTSAYYGVGIDAVPALEALGFGLPGVGGTGLGPLEGIARRAIRWLVEPYICHFPDGNASIARLLVRRLIPEAAPGESMEDVVGAEFDYDRLDPPDAPTRLRLASTAVRVEHAGDPLSADEVRVTYVRHGRAERVRARRCILACYNMAIPHLCPELPAVQREALSSLVKVPLVYTNVLLGNWRAWQRAGVALAQCPGSWHKLTMLDFPVSLGDYGFARTPDDPIVLHMQRVPCRPGLPPRDQHRLGRAELLSTTFESVEREIRTHLGGMLGEAGFDPAREIEAITVNRWPHGYAYTYNPLFDPDYAPGQAPHEIGRRPFGRISIANSDAGARAYLDCAIDEAWRAVNEP